jgi:hypothetical protein
VVAWVRRPGWREGVQVGGQDRPAGPDPLALVTSQAAAPQPIAAFEVADPPLTAGAVAGQAPAGAPRARLGPTRDERSGGCQPGQGLGGRPGDKPAVEGDLARSQPQAIQLGHGLGQQTVLARVAGCAGRREQIAPGAATGVGGDLGQLGDLAELVGRAELALADRTGVRIGQGHQPVGDRFAL